MESLAKAIISNPIQIQNLVKIGDGKLQGGAALKILKLINSQNKKK